MTIAIEPVKATIDGKSYFAELGHIENTMLGREDHGIFTYVFSMNFDGSGQGAGSYCLNDPETFGKHVQAVIDFFGGTWESIKGREVYVLRETQYGPILGFLKKDQSKFIIFSEVLGG